MSAVRKRLVGAAIVVLTVAGGVGLAGVSSAQSGASSRVQDARAANVAANPVLAESAAGWCCAGTRVSVEHEAADYAYETGGAVVYPPKHPEVTGGQEWQLSVDVQGSGRATMRIDWYDGDTYLSGDGGGAVALPASGWARAVVDATAPAAATRFQVRVDRDGSGTWRVTNADYSTGTGSEEPPEEPEGDTAAGNFGWGTPHSSSDEFNYAGSPDPAKWSLPGTEAEGCWPGHAQNGRRCAENTIVDGSAAVMVGEANGDTGWMRSQFDADYGRWEVRSRSANTGSSGELYHVLHLLWPSSEQWPEDGEYDWVEYFDPDADCLTAFLHYPHDPGNVQQERADLCPVDMNEWNNFAFEWTPQHVKGFVNGVEWFSFSGGATSTRRNIQDMQPAGQYTMQLDNFTGDGGLRPATFEMDWYRFYPLP